MSSYLKPIDINNSNNGKTFQILHANTLKKEARQDLIQSNDSQMN